MQTGSLYNDCHFASRHFTDHQMAELYANRQFELIYTMAEHRQCSRKHMTASAEVFYSIAVWLTCTCRLTIDCRLSLTAHVILVSSIGSSRSPAVYEGVKTRTPCRKSFWNVHYDVRNLWASICRLLTQSLQRSVTVVQIWCERKLFTHLQTSSAWSSAKVETCISRSFSRVTELSKRGKLSRRPIMNL